jgi:hypothetical protein
MIFAKVKPVTDIIIILRHPTSSTSRLNFTNQNVNINSIFIELNNWDVCTNFKEVNGPQCLQMLYSRSGLIIKESDHGIMS